MSSFELRLINYNDVIGRGTFSTVYGGLSLSGQRVAIKVANDCDDNNNSNSDADPEIKILQNLAHHPNIVAMLGTFMLDNCNVVAFERLSGIRLYDGAARLQNYNEGTICLIAEQLIDALCFCHKENIVHRDINDDNILWCVPPEETQFFIESKLPIVKLIDFNLAKKIPEKTKMCYGYPMGNTLYMSPEALLDRSVISPASDIWSLGVVLYNLMVGFPPFWEDDYNRLLAHISDSNYSTDAKLWLHVSAKGHEFVCKMLSAEREKRPTARDLIQASDSWLSNKYIHSRNQSRAKWKEIQIRLCLFSPFHTNRNERKVNENGFQPSQEFFGLARRLANVP